ncbi:hypothetical protein ACSNOJ_21995 [Streptomyces sp. URMC 128]|uniref:hypothetical protein n=1 Tax=Streptomyces sp. URMC 128 TaxID=3423404 RepID=UPI003F19D0A6
MGGQSADGGEVVEVGGTGLGEVQGQILHRGLGQDGQGVAEPVEVGGDQQLAVTRRLSTP